MNPTLLVIDVAHLFWAAWLGRSEVGGFRAPIDVAATAVDEAAAGWPHVVLAIDWPPYARCDPERGGSERYKAHRTKDEAGREAQRQLLTQLRAAGRRLVGVRGYEADDVCATLARKGHEAGVEVTIITGDKDLHVLLPWAHVIDVRGGVEVTVEAVRAKWGVGPDQLGDLLAIAGDASDGIPGVAGLGAVKAAELLASRGSLAAVLAEVPLTVAELAAEQEALGKRRRAIAAAKKKGTPLGLDEVTKLDVDAARVTLLARVARIHEPEQRQRVEMSARLVTMREDLEIDVGALVGAQEARSDEEAEPEPGAATTRGTRVAALVAGEPGRKDGAARRDEGPAEALPPSASRGAPVADPQADARQIAPRAEAEPSGAAGPAGPANNGASLAPEPEAHVTGSGAADGPCTRCEVAHLASEPCDVAEARVIAALAAERRAPAVVDRDTKPENTTKETPSMPEPASPVAPPAARPALPPVVRTPPALTTKPAAAPAPQRGASRLASVSAGLVREPYSILVYGVEGVGKTSFVAAASRPLIIGAENGSAEIGNVQRYTPRTFADVLGVLEELLVEKHDFRTIGIDSLDWLEPLVHAAVCLRGNKPSIEAFGYGKGYAEALTEWRTLLKALDAVRTKGMHVVLVAHAHCKTWKNPDADQGDYDRFTLKLNDKAGSLAKEWAKAVLFANFERGTVEITEHRHKGIDTGKRILFTRMRAAYDAKNRLWLPAEIPLGWAPFERAVEAGRGLRERYYAAIAKADDANRASAQEHVEQSNYDPVTIESVIAGLIQAA